MPEEAHDAASISPRSHAAKRLRATQISGLIAKRLQSSEQSAEHPDSIRLTKLETVAVYGVRDPWKDIAATI
jgi:hypothetical protein